MPSIIEYPFVLERLRERGLKCLYHNSGAFGFAADVPTQSFGWIGPNDESIRPLAKALTRAVSAPFEKNLADLAVRAWLEFLPGVVWVMPKSHWAYEMEFGSREWMPALIESVGIDPGMLSGRNNGSAIEFETSDACLFAEFTERLLQGLLGSDFMLVFPDHPIVCTIHSHKQLWWTTSDQAIADRLQRLLPTVDDNK